MTQLNFTYIKRDDRFLLFYFKIIFLTFRSIKNIVREISSVLSFFPSIEKLIFLIMKKDKRQSTQNKMEQLIKKTFGNLERNKTNELLRKFKTTAIAPNAKEYKIQMRPFKL